MADTNFGENSALQVKVYSTEIWRHTRLTSFFLRNGAVGSGIADTNAIIHYINKLSKSSKGHTAVMPLVQQLQGDGRVGDHTLEGYEEKMNADDLSIQVDQIRNGVKSEGAMAEQDTVIVFRANAMTELGYWLASMIDQLCFLTAAGIAYTKKLDGSNRSAASDLPNLRFAADVTAPTSGRKFFAGTATGTSSLAASDTMSWNRIVEIRAEAKYKRLRPVLVGGREYYFIVMSTYQMRDLKKDTVYQTAAAQAEVRGPDNPLWKGAVKVVDGCMLYEHERVPTTLGLASGSKWGASGTVDGAQALLMGAQALGFCNLQDMSYKESDQTDYGNRLGIGIGRQLGMVKAHWYRPEEASDQDYSIMSLYTAAAPVS